MAQTSASLQKLPSSPKRDLLELPLSFLTEVPPHAVILGWALLGVKIETSINRLAFFHKVGPGQGEHDDEKSFLIGSLICPAVRARSYAKMGVAQEGRRDFWLMANWGSIIPLVGVEPLRITPTLFLH